jgi:hypothetical protein
MPVFLVVVSKSCAAIDRFDPSQMTHAF